jgi:hypothetical protein
MRSITFISVAAIIAFTLIWQSPVSAQSKQQQARGLGQCVQMANARGWSRAGEKGRWPFIKRCMQGRVG